MKLTSLSVFIPCFNEEKNVVPMVEAFLGILPKVSDQFEIIIVNDGSIDQTGQIAKKLAIKYPVVKVLNHKNNQGYGASLRTGFAAARYDWIFFTDGDRQFDVTELAKFIPYTTDYDAVIGYRIHRADGSLRAFNARLFKAFIDILFRVHVKDIDCAFKLIKTNHIRSIKFVSTGAMISSELLYRLKKQGVKFKQLPVNHYPRQWGSPTGNNLKVVLKAGHEAVKLYLTMKLGKRA